MRVRLLGTAAGGGFPQWNCNCSNCRAVRDGSPHTRPRTQSGAAITSDGRRWFLLNASPDIQMQIEAFPPLLPPAGSCRGTSIEGILLTNADLDHTLGLLILREGGRLCIHAPPQVREALVDGLNLDTVLGFYGGLEWREPLAALSPLGHADGTPAGLRYAAFAVPGKLPRYRGKAEHTFPGCCVGYTIEDENTGGRLVFLPDVAGLDDDVLARIGQGDLLLMDGTFWSEDEMHTLGAGEGTASSMGHIPIGGSEGSLARIAPLPFKRKVYIHLNNTNPLLMEGSPERAMVEAAGVEVARDGMEFLL